MLGCGAASEIDDHEVDRPVRVELARDDTVVHEAMAEVSSVVEPVVESVPGADAVETDESTPTPEPSISPEPSRRSVRSVGPKVPAGAPAPGLARESVEDFIHEQGVVGLMVQHAGRTGPPPYERLDFGAPDALWKDAVQPAERARVPGFNPDTIRPAGGDADDIVRLGGPVMPMPRSHCVVRTAVDVRPAVAERWRVREAMRRQVTGLLSCRSSERAPHRLPNFELVVSGTGVVVSAALLSGSAHASQTRECLVRQLGRWRMPRPTSGEAYRVRVHRVRHC